MQQQYIHVEYTKGPEGQIEEIRACIVEGDHEGPDKLFRGPNAVEALRGWIEREYPHVDAYSTRLDADRMYVKEMLRPSTQNPLAEED